MNNYDVLKCKKKEKKKETSKEKNHALEQNLDMSGILELSEWEFKITLIGKSSIAIKEIELVVNNFYKNEASSPDGCTCKFCHTFIVGVILNFHDLFQKME